MMITCAEQLPIEIWLMIFRYLEGHDLFDAFHCLNDQFNRILASNYLSFYVRLKETDNNHLPLPSTSSAYWSDAILNRVTCLQSAAQYRSTYFLQFLHFHGNQLIRLQSLSMKISPQDSAYIPFVCKALEALHGLEYLSLICTPDVNLFESILSIRTLQICHLALRETSSMMNSLVNVNNNIKQLFLVFLNHVNDGITHQLVMHMPQLKRLEIAGSYFSFYHASLFTTDDFILPKLRIVKLKLDNAHLRSDCFQCLHSIMPVLKHFYFNYKKHLLSDTFLDYFISDWWSIIERIPSIDIYIKGHVFIDMTNNNSQINLQKHRQVLLNRADQSNGSIKIQWTEPNFTALTLIEISIKKS